MGQLIKLRDYISRYEIDPYHYSGQYVRLKKHQWQLLNKAWEERNFDSFIVSPPAAEKEEEKPSFWGGKWFRKPAEAAADDEPAEEREEGPDMTFAYVPSSNEELRHAFLDNIYRFQLKWASSTIREESDFDRKHYYDEVLQFFLKRLPDHNLYMHLPVFELKNAAVETGSILVTPSGIQCIAWVAGKKEAILEGSNERFWVMKNRKSTSKILNPLLGLNRTYAIVNQILAGRGVDFPVVKRLVFENGYADFQVMPYKVEVTDKRNFQEWFERMRALSSPVKHDQLKAAKVLLDHTATRSKIRSGWDDLAD
ncbi:NERD domain-containing protein [Bacillus mangrovi]|uniref:NERD domain-containing protein n=1 Tax=Metabacillus mangrovi TaxID=1491830 RepID=A0A7X2S8T4_9BACI|nr:NERD domain-containing protein [Metabacillus mangrovi]MTH55625.1 NERD domain-containing protein [Metabacillus mangrovi]